MLMLLALGRATNGQQSKLSTSMTDAELLEQLASSNVEIADRAADMIVARGERMIAPLMKLKGDKRLFAGLLVRNTSPANFVFGPSGDPKQDEKLLKLGKLVTIEVAALYLISAIYFESQHF